MDISECQVEALADPPKVQYVRATGKNRPETLIIKTLSTKTLGVLVIGFPDALILFLLCAGPTANARRPRNAVNRRCLVQ
jgi:hypothetical protein